MCTISIHSFCAHYVQPAVSAARRPCHCQCQSHLIPKPDPYPDIHTTPFHGSPNLLIILQLFPIPIPILDHYPPIPCPPPLVTINIRIRNEQSPRTHRHRPIIHAPSPPQLLWILRALLSRHRRSQQTITRQFRCPAFLHCLEFT